MAGDIFNMNGHWGVPNLEPKCGVINPRDFILDEKDLEYNPLDIGLQTPFCEQYIYLAGSAHDFEFAARWRTRAEAALGDGFRCMSPFRGRSSSWGWFPLHESFPGKR